MTAPVKRLVKIAIEESYYTGREPEDWYKGTRDSGVSSSSFAGSQQAEATEIRTLTERACCPRYDVVRYRFTVVMSTPQVQVLLYNLMARNYHTVMKVEMQTVKADPSPQALYHYGPDAVLEVTVYGEVLLLTDWERGTRDETKGEWSQEYPPLMPVEMLKSIQIRRSSALRPEDNTRIEESPG